jgi:outer membrane protein assembly factor BamA
MQLLLCTPGMIYSQNNRPQTQSPDSTELVIRRVNIEGNDNVKTSVLEGLIRTKMNRELLGIPGFTPWFYIWQLTESFGEQPTLLNYETLSTDLERVTRYYNSIGFLEAAADTSINPYEKNKVKIVFNIEENERSYIESVAYSGLPDSAFSQPEEKINFYKSSKLTEEQINDSTYKADLPYLENQLDLERSRIINFLKNNGYAAIQPDSVSALIKRDSTSDHQLDVLYLINPGQKYTFGDLSIKLAGPGTDTLFTYQQNDTLRGKPFTLNNKAIYLEKEESAQSRFSLLTDQILFKPGDTFNQNRYVRTINEFQNLGMVSIRQFGLSQDEDTTAYSGDEVPVYFALQTLPKHSFNVNVFGLRRYGYGSGAGITYSNNNLFGKAENLQLSLNGSFEYVGKKRLSNLSDDFSNFENISTDSKFFQSFEARADFSLPRLTFPFTGLDENLFFANSRTRYSLSFNRSDQLLFDINSNVTYNQRYEVKHNSRFTSFLDLLQLELLDTNPSEPFRNALEMDFKNNPLALSQILEDFRPQFSSILRYAFRSQRTDLIKRNYGYFSEYSVSAGGNIPFLIDRFFVTPGTVEGDLPSPVKFSDNTLAYSRYLKGTADYRRYIPLSPNTIFAARGFAGYAIPYGQSRTIPLNQRFYAGGSNDIRGWSLFNLGPGSIPFNQVTINGGEIKLLAQTELRQTAIKNFFSSKWIFAFFVDAGNVWYGSGDKIPTLEDGDPAISPDSPRLNLDRGVFKADDFYKQIAVGSGMGLRLDFEYLVARIDFAFRIHDLQEGWLNNGKPYFHFGIGHSF